MPKSTTHTLTMKSTVCQVKGTFCQCTVVYAEFKTNPEKALHVLGGMFSRDEYCEEIDTLRHFGEGHCKATLAHHVLANIIRFVICSSQGFHYMEPVVDPDLLVADP